MNATIPCRVATMSFVLHLREFYYFFQGWIPWFFSLENLPQMRKPELFFLFKKEFELIVRTSWNSLWRTFEKQNVWLILRRFKGTFDPTLSLNLSMEYKVARIWYQTTCKCRLLRVIIQKGLWRGILFIMKTTVYDLCFNDFQNMKKSITFWLLFIF